ncbi:MAG: hypothetical protein WC755_06715 [Candidatus Woesearchaeota archaeon]|jgi:glutamate racemase
MIGILDSGIGGFEALIKIRKKYPKLDIYYHADTENFPFGSKTEEEICKILEKAYKEFAAKKVSHILLSCNTASIISIKNFGKEYEGIPILDLISMYQKAIDKSTCKNLAIIATELTKNILEKNEIFEEHAKMGLNNLVRLIEEGIEENEEEIRTYLRSLTHLENKHVLYACTHFPLIHDLFEAELPTNMYINPTNYLIESFEIININENSNLTFLDNKIEKKFIEFLQKTNF